MNSVLETFIKYKWQLAKVGDIAEIRYGKSLTAEQRVDSGTVPVYGSSGIVGQHNEMLHEGPSIIIGRKGTVGAIYYEASALWCIDTAFYLDNIFSEVDVEYLGHALNWLNLARHSMVVGVPGISRADIEKEQIPFPPLPEQQRIVAILRQADELRHLRREADEKTKQLIKSIFYDMFGDPNPQRNDRGWPEVTIGSQVQIETGGTPPRKQDVFYGGRHAWLRTTELRDSLIVQAEETLSDAGMQVSNTKTFPVDTVVVAMYGQGQTRGRTGKLAIPAATNQACAAFLPSGELLPNYLWYWFQNSYEDVRNLAQGGNQFNLNLSILKNLLIIKPDKDLQEQFSKIVDQYLQLQEEGVKSANSFDILFASLSAQAFTGELTAAWRKQHTAELRGAAARRDALLRERGAQIAEPSAEERLRIDSVGRTGKSIKALLFELLDNVQQTWHEPTEIMGQPQIEEARGFLGEALVSTSKEYARVAEPSTAIQRVIASRMSENLAKPISDFVRASRSIVVSNVVDQEFADHPREYLLRRLPVSHVLVWLVVNSEAGYTTLESLGEATGLTHKALQRILDVFQASGLLTAVSLPTNPSGIRVFVPAYRAFDDVRDEARADDLVVLQHSLVKR